MVLSKKERLKELINKKDEVLRAVFNYDEVYTWIEELYFLLNSLKSRTLEVNNILSTINSIRFHGFTFRNNISQLKAQLNVFLNYQLEEVAF